MPYEFSYRRPDRKPCFSASPICPTFRTPFHPFLYPKQAKIQNRKWLLHFNAQGRGRMFWIIPVMLGTFLMAGAGVLDKRLQTASLWVAIAWRNLDVATGTGLI